MDPLDRISAEEYDSLNECPVYDTKQFGEDAPVNLELWGHAEYPFTTIAPKSTVIKQN